jgi:hypothetical protein
MASSRDGRSSATLAAKDQAPASVRTAATMNLQIPIFVCEALHIPLDRARLICTRTAVMISRGRHEPTTERRDIAFDAAGAIAGCHD